MRKSASLSVHEARVRQREVSTQDISRARPVAARRHSPVSHVTRMEKGGEEEEEEEEGMER